MSYLGAKTGSGVYQAIINLMPPHEVYVEPFLGTGAILLKKPPAPQSIGLDRDELVLNKAQSVIQESDYGGNVELVCDNAITWLSQYSAPPRTVIYCDPPYLHSTRSSDKRYKYEMTDTDHHRLLELLKLSSAAVLISGYRSELYDSLLGDWFSLDFQAMTRGGVRTETVWCNYHPKDVHYHTYAGRNFTDRQRIKRKAERWAKNYALLPAEEKQAILAALLSVKQTPQ